MQHIYFLIKIQFCIKIRLQTQVLTYYEIWYYNHNKGPSNFTTREITKNLKTQENREEHVFKSN